MHPLYESSGDVAASSAYLFYCASTKNFAITLDGTGANLPRQECPQGWERRSELRLGVQETVIAPIDPEPILRGIRAQGYFIWSAESVRNPHGTSQ